VTDRGRAVGAVLAGGEGLRFAAGRPAAKPGATVAGVSMAARAVRALQPHVSAVAVVGPAREAGSEEAPGDDTSFLRRIGVDDVPLLRDEVPGRGPLEGLRVALAWASDLGADRLVVLPCDLPLVDAEAVGRTVRAFRRAPPSVDALVPVAAGRPQPLAGVYRTGLLERIERRVTGADDRSLHALLADLDVERVDVDALSVDRDRFLNVNREEDRLRAERLLAERAPGPVRS